MEIIIITKIYQKNISKNDNNEGKKIIKLVMTFIIFIIIITVMNNIGFSTSHTKWAVQMLFIYLLFKSNNRLFSQPHNRLFKLCNYLLFKPRYGFRTSHIIVCSNASSLLLFKPVLLLFIFMLFFQQIHRVLK